MGGPRADCPEKPPKQHLLPHETRNCQTQPVTAALTNFRLTNPEAVHSLSTKPKINRSGHRSAEDRSSQSVRAV
jgi:hypothetical protein